MVAWSGRGQALAWDPDSIEEAVLLASSIREEALSLERAWGGGMAEGELESFSADMQRMHLASGAAIVAAMSLARVAKPGDVLVDGDVRALRAGQLSLLGARTATDSGRRVRGWRLDLEHPGKRAAGESGSTSADATDRYIVFPPPSDGEPPPLPPSVPTRVRVPFVDTSMDAGATQPMPAVRFPSEAASAGDVRQLVDASSDPSMLPPPTFDLAAISVPQIPSEPEAVPVHSPLVDRVRRLAHGDESADAMDALAELRRARAAAESGPPAARCQAALALAMTLSIARRPEEALVEALDALARAHEARDAKAVVACKALLAKRYAAAGRAEQASALLKP